MAAAVALEQVGGAPVIAPLAARYRCHRRVFLAPAWRERYAADAERRHGLATAVSEYERLALAHAALEYAVSELLRVPTADRADRVLATLSAAPPARATS